MDDMIFALQQLRQCSMFNVLSNDILIVFGKPLNKTCLTYNHKPNRRHITSKQAQNAIYILCTYISDTTAIGSCGPSFQSVV
jgi:hypothetical protein